MAASISPTSAARFAVAQVGLLVAAVALSAQPPVPKDPLKTMPPVGVRLPDGTFLWAGPGGGADGERVLLTPQELQKLLDQVDQLKKQLAQRKATPPSGCAVKGRVEKRGEAVVAALKATYTFRTAAPNTAVGLGAKRAFLVAAALDGGQLPVLDAGEDGFAATIETAGDHTIVLDLEVPVAGRGAKGEIGFELGLPRAAITTLALDLPADVKRVGLTIRTPDPAAGAKPADPRRIPALDAKELAPRPGRDGYPLGPVDSVEVAWEPPAAAAPPDTVQSAEIDVTCLLAEGFVETTAIIRPRGAAKSWRIAAPADAVLTVERAAAAPPGDPAALESPTVTKPGDPSKPVWKVDLPAGTTAADWTVAAVVRSPRAKPADPKHKGPFPVGPFAALDVARQTGTVRVAAAANTRLTVKHGPDVRQDVPPTPPGDETVAFFRFAGGPSGTAPPLTPLLEVEARPLAGALQIRPTYKLTLTERGWQVRADLKVVPVRREIDTVVIEIPADWRETGVSPPELVEGVQQTKADGPRQVLAVRLAATQKQPFDLVLTAVLPVPPGAKDAAVQLPRFPGATARDATLTAAVGDGLEVRGAGREWDADQPAAWGQPLAPLPGPDGKPPKAVTAVGGKFDHGLARADLAWSPYRTELTADVRAEVAVHDGQVVVREQIKLSAADGFGKPIRFRGPAGVKGLKSVPALAAGGPGEWLFTPGPDAKAATLAIEYAVAGLGPAAGGEWKASVGLLWPVGATRTESVVRVWSHLATGRAVGAEPGPWRELPPEPMADRDALPVVTLAGSGSDLPLVLTASDSTEGGAAAVRVERGLIQVVIGGDDTADCRARFLLTRWLADAVEVGLPEDLTGDPPQVLLDGRTVEAPAVPTATGRAVRVPLPEARAGRTAVLEVRYRLAFGGATGRDSLAPPRPKAEFTGPVRWHVVGPAGSAPLVLGGGRAEQRWVARTGMLVPAAASEESLERWFRTDSGPDDGGDRLEVAVVRTAGAGPIRVVAVPRLWLVTIASAVVLVVGLVVSRLPFGMSGPAVAVLGGTAAVLAVLFPQPAGQVAGAAEPGAAVLVLALVGLAVAKRYYRRRVTHLPGFARSRYESPAGPPPGSGRESGRSRPPAPGSTAGMGTVQPASTGSA